MRMCVACHKNKPKKDLIRVVKKSEKAMSEQDDNKEICIDKTGKISGRGAYLCNDVECFKDAKKYKKLDKSLETRIDDKVYDDLIQQMEEVDD